MRTKSEQRPIATIILTIIISSVILASSTYLFYFYLIPLYNIDIHDLYTILIRLLPIIIGLLLTIISLVIAPVHIPQTSSKDDELPIDSYTAPLYNLPDEEKNHYDSILLIKYNHLSYKKQSLTKPFRQ